MALTIGSSAREGTVPPGSGGIHTEPEEIVTQIEKVQRTIPDVEDAIAESQSVAKSQTSDKWADLQETERCRYSLAD
ncbi:MAG: hypothetical protein Q4P05_08850, partial [Actinomycetaceae bacterium]|nr:hypothetical protein [Actinomycetaceae bacterium]